jgi:hypothetical protein
MACSVWKNFINRVAHFCIRAIVCFLQNAGWSSLVARQAHNLKAVGSNPTPATTLKLLIEWVLRWKERQDNKVVLCSQMQLDTPKMKLFGHE